MPRRKRRLPVYLCLAAVVVVSAAELHHYRHHHHAEQLGAGAPLDQTHSQIKVLTPSEDTPTKLPTDTSSTAIIGEPHGPTAKPAAVDNQPIILTSATVITTPAPQPAAANDSKTIKLGLTLTLLANEYASGGPAALATLESAAKLATSLNDSAMGDKLTDLKKNTPANGPITPALLLVEAQRVNGLGAPASDEDEAAEPSDWLHNLIKVRSANEDAPEQAAQANWATAMQSVMLQLAANNPAGASTLLNAEPLKTDDRLDDLRTALAGYLSQSTSLNAVLAAYASEGE